LRLAQDYTAATIPRRFSRFGGCGETRAERRHPRQHVESSVAIWTASPAWQSGSDCGQQDLGCPAQRRARAPTSPRTA